MDYSKLPPEFKDELDLNDVFESDKPGKLLWHWAYHHSKRLSLAWEKIFIDIVDIKDTHYLVYYAQDIIKGRWPEAEDKINKLAKSSRMYNSWIDRAYSIL